MMKVKWGNMGMVIMQAGGLLLARRRQRAYAEQRAERLRAGLNDSHGFKTYYYGIGILRK